MHSGCSPNLVSPADALVGLQRQRRQGASGCASPDNHPVQGTWPAALPTLPLLSLRWLALPLPLALAFSGALVEAQHLDTLCLQLPCSYADFDGCQWPMLWQFVTTHPSLRRLLYEVRAHSQPCSYQLLDALLLLQRRRPSLQVRRLTAPAARIYCPPACWAELDA